MTNVRKRFENNFYDFYLKSTKNPDTKEVVFERKDEGYMDRAVNNAFIEFCGKCLRGEIK